MGPRLDPDLDPSPGILGHSVESPTSDEISY